MLATIRPILEMLYFLSGIVLAICAIIALNQIRIGREQIAEQKKAMSISAKRESLKTTIDYISFYSTSIIPKENEVDHIIKDENIKVLKETKYLIKDDKIVGKPLFTKEDIDCITRHANSFTNLLNDFECVASCFLSGIADEQYAFYSIARNYCSTVEELLPLIAITEEDDVRYMQTKKLFVIWKKRLEKEENGKKIKSLQDQIDKAEDKSVKIIGA